MLAHPETEEYWNREGHAETGTWASLMVLKEAMAARPNYVRQVLPLEQERVTTLAQFGEACKFFFVDEVELDPKATEKWFTGHDHVDELFQFLVDRLVGLTSISHDECEALIREYSALKGMEKLGPVVHPTRVALTGKTAGPSLFDLMSVLGPEAMVARLTRAKGMLS